MAIRPSLVAVLLLAALIRHAAAQDAIVDGLPCNDFCRHWLHVPSELATPEGQDMAAEPEAGVDARAGDHRHWRRYRRRWANASHAGTERPHATMLPRAASIPAAVPTPTAMPADAAKRPPEPPVRIETVPPRPAEIAAKPAPAPDDAGKPKPPEAKSFETTALSIFQADNEPVVMRVLPEVAKPRRIRRCRRGDR